MSKQHLDRKTVLNIVYTQQATRMADAYETLLADFSQMTAWGRGLESDLSHARVEISFLKAEVERLDILCKQLMTQHSDISCENIMLRKAGDAMADWLDELGSPRAVPFFQAWLAAKEGKPSV